MGPAGSCRSLAWSFHPVDNSGVQYTVRLVDASRDPSPTAVVPITTNWSDFPAQWTGLLNEVYAAAAAGAFAQNGHNIMVFLDDRPRVEVGIQVARAFTPVGRVVPSRLPAGTAAMAVHQGPYDRLNDAHVAVRRWCAGRGLRTTGVRWEIYGDWAEDPAQLETEVWYQVAGAPDPNVGPMVGS